MTMQTSQSGADTTMEAPRSKSLKRPRASVHSYSETSMSESPSKRTASAVTSTPTERPETVEGPNFSTFGFEEALETPVLETSEASKYKGELEAQPSCRIRLQDMDESIRKILAGVSSDSPKESLMEFRQLLRGDDSGNLLCQYMSLSPKCTEIMSIWSASSKRDCSVALLQLLDELMKHPMGKTDDFQHINPKSQAFQVVQVRLDKVARLIISSKLKDIYAHLASGQRSRQLAALQLLASIVKRGSMLASELASTFDFTLHALADLARVPKYKRRDTQDNLSTRTAFIDFAMSFLEVCHAALLRWVLQVRPLYGSVLHKLSNDDEMTIVHVLKVFQLKVLNSDAMIPPGLQSALFGDLALEQMAIISSDLSHTDAAQVAHNILTELCTDVSHGICPEPSLLCSTSSGKAGHYGGGLGRLVRLMTKLKATEVKNHRNLALSIAKERPAVVASYFHLYPYNLEPRNTHAWFAAASLASDIILVSKARLPVEALANQGLPPPKIDSAFLQTIFRSLLPKTLTRLVINRGLLHENVFVRHGCLRMLSEVVSAAEFYLRSFDNALVICQQKFEDDESLSVSGTITQVGLDACPGMEATSAGNNDGYDLEHDEITGIGAYHKWLALEKEFKTELRALLPDPQVLFSVLSSKPRMSYSSSNDKGGKGSIGATQNNEWVPYMEKDDSHEDGVANVEDDLATNGAVKLVDIWNAEEALVQSGELEDVKSFLNAKVMDVLAIYQRIIPNAIAESGFEVFKLLPESSLSLSSSQLKALSALLIAASENAFHASCGSQMGFEILYSRHLFRFLKPILKFMLESKTVWARKKWMVLAHRAMFSCGAFENNRWEIGIWLQFLSLDDSGVLSFFCDVVETMGRNMDKFMETLISVIHSFSENEILSEAQQFGPLVVCALDKCFRVIVSNSKKTTISQKTDISVYVTNSLCLLLQSQVLPQLLSNVLDALLSSRLYEASPDELVFKSEWTPLHNLLLYVRWYSRRDYKLLLTVGNVMLQSDSLTKVLEICKGDITIPVEAKAVALTACVQCAPPQEIAENFPLLMQLFFSVFKGKIVALVGLFGAYQTLFLAVSKLWPKAFEQALLSASDLAHSVEEVDYNSIPFDGWRSSLSLPSLLDIFRAKEAHSPEGIFDDSSVAFALFLLGLPFAVIFPALASSDEAKLWRSPHLQNILKVALFKVSSQDWLCTSNLILHWVDNLWESDSGKSDSVGYQLEVCFSLLKLMVLPSENHGWLSLLLNDNSAKTELDFITEFLQGVLTHPVMNAQLNDLNFFKSTVSYSCDGTETEMDQFDAPQVFQQWFPNGVSEFSTLLGHTVAIFQELLQWASNPLNQNSSGAHQKDQLMLQNIISVSCEPFLSHICVAVKTFAAHPKQTSGIISYTSVFLAYIFAHHLSINALAEISCSLLSEDLSEEVVHCNFLPSGWQCHAIGIYFAAVTFNRVVTLVQGPNSQQKSMLYKHQLRTLHQRVFCVVLKRPCDVTFACLLSSLEAHRQVDYLAFYEWSQVGLAAGHLELLSCLMTCVNKLKAKIILRLIQFSEFYLSMFVEMLSCNLRQGSATLTRLAPLTLCLLLPEHRSLKAAFTLEDKINLLLPINWLVHLSACEDQATNSKVVEEILDSYRGTIAQIFNDWNVLGTFLDTEEVQSFLELREDDDNFNSVFGSTAFGQVVLMLKHCLGLHIFSFLEKRNFFSLIAEKTFPLFGSSVKYIYRSSLEATVELVCRITAESFLAKNLLLSEIQKPDGVNSESVVNSSDIATEENDSKMKKASFNTSELVFLSINMLCILLELRLTERLDDKDTVDEVSVVKTSLSKVKLLRMLERRLLEDLKCVLKSTANGDLESRHIPTSKRFTKLVLRYRYGESLPMQVLRLYASRLTHFPDFCNLYAAYGLDLLVGHSQFASTIMSDHAYRIIDVTAKFYGGSFSSPKSMPSIISLLKTPPIISEESKPFSESNYGPKLELLKFLRLLYKLKQHAASSNKSVDQIVDPRELLCLLLAAYGASLNRVDLENLSLMREMECFEGTSFPGLAGMNYMWGEAALRWRQSITNSDHACHARILTDNDISRELHNRCFSEELPIDPVRCALGVIFFPVRRKLPEESKSSLDDYEDKEKEFNVESAEGQFNDAAYDPCFVLPFALHSLSCGLLEARDFVLKGLLAFTFMSTASVEEAVRKLGYEILAKFLKVLEDSPSFRGKPQLKLLLLFMKNSVVEPWQRLPSVSALFAAEASCVLVKPSDVHYPIISKVLFRTASLDLETIPLFKPMFGSGSVHFRADRSWALRLLLLSLRTSFDAQIYRRRFILEILMSFYGSPLGDRHTREWTLQILFRASKLRSFVQYLVEHSGLLSWLTIILSTNGAASSGEYLGGVSMKVAQDILQIFENCLQWRSVKRWLILEGFEELSKMAVVLHGAVVETPTFARPYCLLKPYLRILGTAFRVSRARRKFQSHLNFTLTDFDALIQLAEREKELTHDIRLLMLNTILECEPPACCSNQDRFLLWKIGTCLVSLGLEGFKKLPESQHTIHDASVNKSAGNSEDVRPSVFRWLSTSLILGESNKVKLECAPTAWTFFKTITWTTDCGSDVEADVNKDLLQLFIHQQCLFGTVVTDSSAVCAVLLLLPLMKGPCGTFIKDFQELLKWPLQQLAFPYELDAGWQWKLHQRRRESLFESEICQMLFTIFQQLLFFKESTELYGVVETIQLRLRRYAKEQDNSFSAPFEMGSPGFWKHLKWLFQHKDVHGTNGSDITI